jgi:hypothetical protein
MIGAHPSDLGVVLKVLFPTRPQWQETSAFEFIPDPQITFGRHGRVGGQVGDELLISAGISGVLPLDPLVLLLGGFAQPAQLGQESEQGR